LNQNLEILIGKLQQLDPNIDAFEIADMLWLSQYVFLDKKEENNSISENIVLEDKDENKDETKNSNREKELEKNKYKEEEIEKDSNNFSFNKGKNSSKSLKLEKLKKEKFFDLKIARQLKPLKRKIQLHNEMLLDIEKTVEFFAETKVLQAILRPSESKEFTLSIVIDKGTSMFLWEELITNFKKDITTYGIFDKINFYYLSSDESKVQLFADKNLTIPKNHKIAELNHRRNITFVLSDCVSLSWRTNSVYDEFINFWTKNSFVAIVQMLPHRMWKRTPLNRGYQVNFKTNSFLTPLNSSLDIDLGFIQRKVNKKTLKIPIISFDNYSFEYISKIITSTPNIWISGVAINNFKFQEFLDDEKEKLSAKERIDYFFSVASPEAQILAIYCSVLPLSLGIIKEVQKIKNLEQDITYIAEFYFGKLLKKSKIFEQGFEFYDDEVRELLRANLNTIDAFELSESLSDFMKEDLGTSIGFNDLLYENLGDEELSDKDRELVKIFLDTFRHRGGKFENLGKKITQRTILKNEPIQTQTSIVNIKNVRGHGIGALVDYDNEDGYSTVITTKDLIYNDVGELLNTIIDSEHIDLNKVDSIESFDLVICKIKKQENHSSLDIENTSSKMGTRVAIVTYIDGQKYTYNAEIKDYNSMDSFKIKLTEYIENVSLLSGSPVIDITTNKIIGIVSMLDTNNSIIQVISIRILFEKLEKTLFDVISIEIGKSYENNQENNSNLDMPLIKVENLKKDIEDIKLLDTDSFQYRVSSEYDKYIKIDNTSLLIASYNHNRHKPTIFNSSNNIPHIFLAKEVYALIIDKPSLLLVEYLYFLFYSDEVSTQIIDKYLTGVTRKRLNKNQLKNLLESIDLPSIEEQKKYIEIQKSKIPKRRKKRSKVILYKENDLDVDLISLVNQLNQICTYLYFEVGREKFSLNDNLVSKKTSYKNLNSSIHNETKNSFASFFFTKKAYSNNYFFEDNKKYSNLMIVSFFNWKNLTTVSYSKSIAYFVAEVLALDLSDYQHQNNTGCLYDYSANKSDIDKNMKEAQICQDCYVRIEKNKSKKGFDLLGDIEKILEFVREEAIWVIAPGEEAKIWNECRDGGYIAIGWDEINVNVYKSKNDLRDDLISIYNEKSRTRKHNFLWNFAKVMKIGDTIIARNGRSIIVGIGRVSSNYISPNNKNNPRIDKEYKQIRRVEWLDTQEHIVKKNLFPINTVYKIEGNNEYIVKVINSILENKKIENNPSKKSEERENEFRKWHFEIEQISASRSRGIINKLKNEIPQLIKQINLFEIDDINFLEELKERFSKKGDLYDVNEKGNNNTKCRPSLNSYIRFLKDESQENKFDISIEKFLEVYNKAMNNEEDFHIYAQHCVMQSWSIVEVFAKKIIGMSNENISDDKKDSFRLVRELVRDDNPYIYDIEVRKDIANRLNKTRKIRNNVAHGQSAINQINLEEIKEDLLYIRNFLEKYQTNIHQKNNLNPKEIFYKDLDNVKRFLKLLLTMFKEDTLREEIADLENMADDLIYRVSAYDFGFIDFILAEVNKVEYPDIFIEDKDEKNIALLLKENPRQKLIKEINKTSEFLISLYKNLSYEEDYLKRAKVLEYKEGSFDNEINKIMLSSDELVNIIENLNMEELSNLINNKKRMNIKFDFLKANSGESIIVSTENTNIIIDGGTARTYKQELKSKVKKMDILDLVIVTHRDDNHAGGLWKLIEDNIDREKIKEIWFNGFFKENEVRKSIILSENVIQNYNIPYKNNIFLNENNINQSYKVNDIQLQLLSPVKKDSHYMRGKKDRSIENASSIAFILKYQNKKFLFLADASVEVINYSLKQLGYSKENRLKIDFVKLSHGGSIKNIDSEFLDIVSTNRYIILTDGKRFGFPHKETLELILTHKLRAEFIEFICNYQNVLENKLSEEEVMRYNCKLVYATSMEF